MGWLHRPTCLQCYCMHALYDFKSQKSDSAKSTQRAKLCISGENTVCAPYIYGSGQPYILVGAHSKKNKITYCLTHLVYARNGCTCHLYRAAHSSDWSCYQHCSDSGCSARRCWQRGGLKSGFPGHTISWGSLVCSNDLKSRPNRQKKPFPQRANCASLKPWAL